MSAFVAYVIGSAFGLMIAYSFMRGHWAYKLSAVNAENLLYFKALLKISARDDSAGEAARKALDAAGRYGERKPL